MYSAKKHPVIILYSVMVTWCTQEKESISRIVAKIGVQLKISISTHLKFKNCQLAKSNFRQCSLLNGTCRLYMAGVYSCHIIQEHNSTQALTKKIHSILKQNSNVNRSSLRRFAFRGKLQSNFKRVLSWVFTKIVLRK